MTFGHNDSVSLVLEDKMTKAQAVIEYAILISVVAIAFVAMKTYVERSVNANIKLIEEQINAESD